MESSVQTEPSASLGKKVEHCFLRGGKERERRVKKDVFLGNSSTVERIHIKDLSPFSEVE